jgi:hypothetical protein
VDFYNGVNAYLTNVVARFYDDGVGGVDAQVDAVYPAGTAGMGVGINQTDFADNNIYAPDGSPGTAEAYLTYDQQQFAMTTTQPTYTSGDALTLSVRGAPATASGYEWFQDGMSLGRTTSRGWSGTAGPTGPHTYRSDVFDASGKYIGNAQLDIDVQ